MNERSWKIRPSAYEVPDDPLGAVVIGVRDDGQKFMLKGQADFADRLPTLRSYLIRQMDSFLSPNCTCVVGTNCDMHKDLK